MAQIILTFGLGKEKIKVVRSIAQKNRITPVSLTERIFRYRALNTYVLKYRSHQNLPGLLSKD